MAFSLKRMALLFIDCIVHITTSINISSTASTVIFKFLSVAFKVRGQVQNRVARRRPGGGPAAE